MRYMPEKRTSVQTATAARPFEAAKTPLSAETRAWLARRGTKKKRLNPDFAALALPVKE